MRAGRNRLWILALLLMAVVFFVPLPAALEHDRTLSRIGDLAHLPLLAALTIMLQARGPLAGRPGAAAAAAAVLSVLIELVQGLTGREPALLDLLLDGVGIVVGLGLIAWRRRRRSWPLAAALLLAALATAWHLRPVPGWLAAESLARRRFPLLDDFETRAEWHNWRGSRLGEVEAAPAVPDPGTALRVVVVGEDPYPGADLRGFPADWRGRTRLLWRARAPVGEPSLAYDLRLDDYAGEGTDEATVGFRAGPAWRDYEVDLTRLRTVSDRPLDLARMKSLLFFLPGAPPGTALELDDIRLR